MKRVLYGAAALALIGSVGMGARSALGWRAEARAWRARAEELLRNPAGRDRYQRDNRRVREEGHREHRTVFLGAELTRSLPLGQAFPGRPFVNRGLEEELAWQALLRVDPDALDLDPEGVVLELSARNFTDGAPPLEETEHYVAALAERCRARNVKAVLVTAAPVSRAWDALHGGGVTDRLTRYNNWVREQARAHQDLLVDLAAALSDDEGYLPDALSGPGLLPNDAGQQRVLAVLRAALLEGRGQPPLPVVNPPAPEVHGAPPVDGQAPPAPSIALPAPTPTAEPLPSPTAPDEEPKDR
ncbi:MAG: hypothetical protein HY909_22530 [Deltaproteobacteria bacterium]|nr:hypothetical protein [Deltaproteobacteria bacterium]